MTPEPSYRTISLDKGQVTLVSKQDYEWLNQWTWFASPTGNGSFYAARSTWDGLHRRRLLMHREILGLTRGDGKLGDHRNLNKLDNRRENLRVATHAGNVLNTPRRQDNTSGCKGVYFWPERNKWYARVHVNKKMIFLGYFIRKEDAVDARREAAKNNYGEFMREK